MDRNCYICLNSKHHLPGCYHRRLHSDAKPPLTERQFSREQDRHSILRKECQKRGPQIARVHYNFLCEKNPIRLRDCLSTPQPLAADDCAPCAFDSCDCPCIRKKGVILHTRRTGRRCWKRGNSVCNKRVALPVRGSIRLVLRFSARKSDPDMSCALNLV